MSENGVSIPSSKELVKEDQKLSTNIVVGNPTEGQIRQVIGTGEDAKNSIVWITIRWSFIIGGIITLLIYAKYSCNANEDLMDDIKNTWSIFMPIISLALGYTFGKGN